MCTVMFYRETLPAEKRSAADSQKAVDRLMEYDRALSAPFGKEELGKFFPGNVCAHNTDGRITNCSRRPSGGWSTHSA